MIYFSKLQTPFPKTIFYAGSQEGISFLSFFRNESEFFRHLSQREKYYKRRFDSVPVFRANFYQKVTEQLQQYFDGERTKFDLRLDLKGSPFQLAVWNRLQTIPYGKTVTYKEIAAAFGGTQFSRAVGSANAKNPISVIIPCHRVIGSNGKLTGYAGGLEVKEWLLSHENQCSTF